jgi:hypothetical protein
MAIISNAEAPSVPKIETESVSAEIESAVATIGFSSASIDLSKRRLLALSLRLRQGQLQLAVVGQFKRGKSTLLNALLGAPILPSAVVPLTAIPAFIRRGSGFYLKTEMADGQKEHLAATNAADLHALLTARVTEEGNPHNSKGFIRVDVSVDAPILGEGIVFIDTPGVGSTFRHNTEAAKAALPECDVGLFVVSPEPPITDVELTYLRELSAVTNNILIILNKIDQVSGKDRARIEKFLKDTVAEGGLRSAEFLCVSARDALEAKLEGNEVKLAASGLPALEKYLVNFARDKRHSILGGSVSQKARTIVWDVLFEIETKLAVHRMPIDDLTERVRQFEAAGGHFERERKTARDILTGDRKRLLSALDEKASALRGTLEDKLNQEVDAMAAHGLSESEISVELEKAVPALFQPRLEQFESETRQMLGAVLQTQQQRGDVLIGDIRHLASTLLDIPFAAPVADDAFQIKKTPYWVTAPRETFITIPHLAESLLPAGIRLKRLKRRLAGLIGEIVIRNVENLRWAIRQNLENSIRAFETQLDDQLKLTQGATLVAMEQGLKRRMSTEDASAGEVEQLQDAKARLLVTVSELEAAS